VGPEYLERKSGLTDRQLDRQYTERVFAFSKTNDAILFGCDSNFVLVGFGHASYDPPRGQFLQGNATVSIANLGLAFPVSRLS